MEKSVLISVWLQQ